MPSGNRKVSDWNRGKAKVGFHPSPKMPNQGEILDRDNIYNILIMKILEAEVGIGRLKRRFCAKTAPFRR